MYFGFDLSKTIKTKNFFVLPSAPCTIKKQELTASFEFKYNLL